MVFIGDVRIFDVEVIVIGNDLFDGDAPGQLTFFAIFPPRLFAIKFFNGERAGFGIGDVAFRIGMLEIPNLFGGLAFGEEKQVGVDACVGIERLWATGRWCAGCIPSTTFL